jgi:hypothetical protein
MGLKARRLTKLGFAMDRSIALIPLITLFSCDCYQSAEGVILDANSRLPLDNVQIVTSNDFERGQTEHLETSNEKGQFSYSDISGGLFGCPDLVLVFSKEGYYNQRISFDSGSKSDTIYLKGSK